MNDGRIEKNAKNYHAKYKKSAYPNRLNRNFKAKITKKYLHGVGSVPVEVWQSLGSRTLAHTPAKNIFLRKIKPPYDESSKIVDDVLFLILLQKIYYF